MTSLADDIDAFLAAHNMSPRRFGELALNDTKLVHDLRFTTRSPSLRTVAKIKHFMANYRPDEQDAAA